MGIEPGITGTSVVAGLPLFEKETGVWIGLSVESPFEGTTRGTSTAGVDVSPVIDAVSLGFGSTKGFELSVCEGIGKGNSGPFVTNEPNPPVLAFSGTLVEIEALGAAELDACGKIPGISGNDGSAEFDGSGTLAVLGSLVPAGKITGTSGMAVFGFSGVLVVIGPSVPTDFDSVGKIPAITGFDGSAGFVCSGLPAVVDTLVPAGLDSGGKIPAKSGLAALGIPVEIDAYVPPELDASGKIPGRTGCGRAEFD